MGTATDGSSVSRPAWCPARQPCRRWRFDAAVYVLGALAPAERHAYEEHLQQCPDCLDDVTQIAAMPGLLRRLSAGDVPT